MTIDKTQFIPQFKSETKERIQKLNGYFLVLEKTPGDTDIFEDLIREAHSIKGSAAMMGFDEISKIAHRMENAFDAKNKSLKIQENMDIFFECLDTIESLLEEQIIGQAKGLNPENIKNLCNRLDEALSAEIDSNIADEIPEEHQATPQEQPDGLPSQICKSELNRVSEPEQATLLKLPEEKTVTPKPTESLRVSLDKLNELMNLSGEMLISKIRLSQLIDTLNTKIQSESELCELEKIATELKEANEKFCFVSSNIQDEVMKLRMIPISNLFSQFPRAMRDLAHKNQKKIEFDMTGGDTYLDKSIIDQMKDPLMHLLRNAVDHGIELPTQRIAHNKPETGKISLNAYHSGSQAVIEIIDDGDGINVGKVKKQIIDRNLESIEKVNQMTDNQIFQFLFMPGFSTADIITETSGRGVGMDVVKEGILKLKGTIEITSNPGSGTKFIIRLPLTLMITECLLVDCGNEIFGLSVDSISETARIDLNEIKTIANKEVINIRDEVIPLARLSNLFSIPQKGIVEKNFFPVIIVQSVKNKLAILVDQITGHHEVVVRALGYPLRKTKNISGGAVMGDGKVILILDVPSIMEIFDYGSGFTSFTEQNSFDVKKSAKTVLLAEDTLSTAMLEKSILEAAGFKVVVAHDGKDALDKSTQEKFDLVITDVLMPKMNGYELTATLKKDKVYKNIPVLIVTTRESDSDKRMGLQAGADAYLIKKDFTSDKLLETIDQLIMVEI